jgi:FixJ family two-component response regulator
VGLVDGPFVQKPFSPQDLAEAIRCALEPRP